MSLEMYHGAKEFTNMLKSILLLANRWRKMVLAIVC